MQGHVGLGFRDEGLGFSHEGLGFREGVSGLEFSRNMQVFLGLYRDIQGHTGVKWVNVKAAILKTMCA